MIVFLTTDLMMASNANSHAKQKGIEIKTADSAQSAIELINDARPHLFLIDLQTPQLDVDELGELVRDLADSVCPLTIAYAQHVNVEVLNKAQAAGFDQVMTRGQFNSQISNIISEV